MHAHDIEAAMKKAGLTQTALANELGVPRSTIYAVLHGKGRSRQVEERISELTRIPQTELWPHWYGDAPARVSVVGDGNQVAGRDVTRVHAPEAIYAGGLRLTIAEERLLRLFRALEQEQQGQLESYARKLIAGG